MANIALSIDLNTTRLTRSMFERIVYDMSSQYNITNIVFYNYSQPKDASLGGIKNVVYMSLATGRRKVMIDMRQAADIVQLSCDENINSIFVICGLLDADAILSKSDSLGKKIIIGCNSKINLPYQQYLLQRNHQHISSVEPNTGDDTPNRALQMKYSNNLSSFSVNLTDNHVGAIIEPVLDQNIYDKYPQNSSSLMTRDYGKAVTDHEIDIDIQLSEINKLLQSI